MSRTRLPIVAPSHEADALSGSALVVLGHVVGDLHVVEWTGVLMMLAGGLGEHFRLVRAARAAAV